MMLEDFFIREENTVGTSADYTHANRAFDGRELIKRLLIRTLCHVGDHISCGSST